MVDITTKLMSHGEGETTEKWDALWTDREAEVRQEREAEVRQEREVEVRQEREAEVRQERWK